MKRKFLLLAASLSVIALLGGCSVFTDTPVKGSLTLDEAEKLVESVEGVTSATYSIKDWYYDEETATSPNTINSFMDVTIDPSYHVEDTESFLRFLMATIWSIQSKQPNDEIVIRLEGGLDFYGDTYEVMGNIINDRGQYLIDYSGIEDDDEAGLNDGQIIITVYSTFYASTLGEWPLTTTPEVPKNMITFGPVIQTIPEALSRVELRLASRSGSEACYELDNVVGQIYRGAEWDGTMNLIWSIDGVVLDNLKVEEETWGTVTCIPAEYGFPTVEYETTPQDGFAVSSGVLTYEG